MHLDGLHIGAHFTPAFASVIASGITHVEEGQLDAG